MIVKIHIKPFYIYVMSVLFFIIIIGVLFVAHIYVKMSNINIALSMKKNIRMMMEEKLYTTFDIARVIASDRAVKNVMQRNTYGNLNKTIIDSFKRYKYYKHLEIDIIDKHGIYVRMPVNEYGYQNKQDNALIRYLIFSHTHTRINDFQSFNKSCKCISLERNGIAFKSIFPIYSYSGEFLGLVEVKTHFNSIIKALKKDGINSVIVISKQYTKFLVKSLFKNVIDGYFISNVQIDKILKDLLKRYGIERAIRIRNYAYLIPKSNLINGYYVVSLPIKNNVGHTIGYYIGFSYDKNGLFEKTFILYVSTFLLVVIFIIIAYIGYQYGRANKKLLNHLNKRVEKQSLKISELIYIDGLTKIFNKIKFDEDIQNISSEMHIVMFDIKNFSKINYIYGFKFGDKILKIVAKRVKNLINRPIYRIHADEFVFFAKDYKNDIDKIKAKFIKEPIFLKEADVKLRLSFSFGVCKNNTKDVLSKLSIAIKEAKGSLYAEFVVYKEQNINKDFIKFNSLLYNALFCEKNARIIPYFQGIRDNKKKKCVKYEALARLVTDTDVYSPFFFLDVAKSSGFITEVTKIITKESLKYISSNDLNVDISINITEDDLNKDYLKEYLDEMINIYGVEPKRITLEILEGITSSGTKNNIKKLKELKALGVKLALDDFGVEYSNFERIAHIDIDYIKIDSKYVKDMAKNTKSRKIVKAITDFAHSIDIEVVAEFVDNDEVQRIVEDLGIEYSQGYLFSVPSEKIK